MTPKIVLNMYRIGRKVPEGTVYVGRPSRWGNPYVTNRVQPDTGYALTREQAIQKFKMYAIEKDYTDPTWLEPLKDAVALVCWCSPKPCHAEFLIEMLERKYGTTTAT